MISHHPSKDARRPQPNASPEHVPDTAESRGPRERFRWPVFVLGAALIPLNSLWIARAEAMDYSGFPTCASLFYNVIFSLLALLLVNAVLRRFIPSIALCRRELIVVYGMLATGSSLVGHDYMQMLVPSIPHAAYYAKDGDLVAKLVVPHLPQWLTIGDLTESIKRYEQGHSTLYRWDFVRPWVVPVAAWSVFLLATIASTLSINVILGRHWVDNERLTYPIAQIPLLITEGGGANATFGSRVFWVGFAIAATLDLWNGAAQLFPSIPALNVKMTNISYLFQSRPWSAVGWTIVSFYPFVIGLSYFMPTDVSFSSWFFFLFRKAQQIFAATAGYEGADAWFPYLKEQSFGALIALFATTLWFGRGHLREVWESIADNKAGSGYRTASLVLVICLCLMLGFLVIAGLRPWAAALYVALYLMFCGALTRIRAELGPPAHELGSVGVSGMMVVGVGTTVLGPRSLAILGLLHFQNRMHRGLLMPQQAESLKAASQSGLRTRTMVAALSIAGVVGVLSAFWALLHLSYGRTAATAVHPGAPGSGFAFEAYNTMSNWMNTPLQPNPAGIFALGAGAAMAMLLARLTVAFYGFPFHPAGYALGMAFGMDYIWLPVMASWLLKVLILRYTGLRGYRAAMPFFVGLVLGEFAVGGMWSFIRGVLGVKTYTFFY